MPLTGVKLMQLLQRPCDDLEIKELAALVEQDPVLAARMLRIANSPTYGALRAVTGVRQAIVAIGLGESVAALNYFFMRKLIPAIPALPGFNPEAFWQHSVACAQTARLLGHPRYHVQSLPGELYLAGLLHDIGKLLLAIYFPGEYAKCLKHANEFQAPLHQIESAALGVNHALLGAHLLDEWQLPGPILNAVCHHHDPLAEGAQQHEMALLVHLADRVVTEAAQGNSGSPAPERPAESAHLRVRLGPLASAEGWQQFLGEVSQQLALKEPAYRQDVAPADAKQPGDALAAVAERQGAPPAKAASLWRRIRGWFGG